jgi:hypothetical protein
LISVPAVSAARAAMMCSLARKVWQPGFLLAIIGGVLVARHHNK